MIFARVHHVHKVKDLFVRNLHPSYCFYAMIWGIILSIPLSLSFKISCPNSRLLVSLVVGGLSIFFVLHHSKPYKLLPAFLLGFYIGSLRVAPDLSSMSYFRSLTGQTITLVGQISNDPLTTAGQTKLYLDHLYLQTSVEHPNTKDYGNGPPEFSSDSWLPLAGTIYVGLSSSTVKLERSDLLVIRGSVGAGFGTFVASFYRPELQNIYRTTTGDVFARLKTWFAALVRQNLSSPEVDLGLGYLMGEKSGLSDSFSETLSAVGMTHVVVASGAHLGILIGFAKKLFGKISKFAGLLFSILFVVMFALVVGFTPSMTRAALVTGLSLLVGYLGRSFTPFRLLSLVAALTLLFVPINFFHLGWQLSFASFAGILIFAPLFQSFLYGGKKPPWLARMLITSISTSLICAPILIYNFGSLSFLSLIANLFILPTLPYAMLLVFLSGLTTCLPCVASLISTTTTCLLRFHIFIIEFLGQQTTLILNLPSSDSRIFIIYIPILVVTVILIRLSKKRQKSYDMV